MKTSQGLSTPSHPHFVPGFTPNFSPTFSNRHILTQYHLLRHGIVSKSEASISQLVMTGHMKNKETVQ